MGKVIEIQEFLRPVLPRVLGCKDYAQEEELLFGMDRILRGSGIEDLFLELSLARFEDNAAKLTATGEKVQSGAAATERYLRHSRAALRCTVLKNVVGGSYRQMSKLFAMSPLYRWFGGMKDFEAVRVPGKSTLRDYAHWLPVQEMTKVLDALTRAMADGAKAREIGLASELDLAVAWIDTTCLKANIHFPTDWVLLRDGVRTLVASILTIRRHGLRHRMAEPESLLRQVNALCMGMAAASRRKPGGKKERKAIFRSLKKLTRIIEGHGQRYRDALDARWEETDLSRPQAEVILARIDNVLDQLPEARRQAHERIIGERKVLNADKILSLYEADLHVIVRGKAGAAVEFGNGLFLAENCDGFIADHHLCQDDSPGDAKLLIKRLPGLKEKCVGQLCAAITDRGFESASSRRLLESEDIFNGLCPRDPHELSRRLQEDEAFAAATRRRAQTEGRIGILKNVFLQGGIPRAKGHANRELQVAWAVLSHNLWVVARMPWAAQESETRLAA
jgi:hypothetical protein